MTAPSGIKLWCFQFCRLCVCAVNSVSLQNIFLLSRCLRALMMFSFAPCLSTNQGVEGWVRSLQTRQYSVYNFFLIGFPDVESENRPQIETLRAMGNMPITLQCKDLEDVRERHFSKLFCCSLPLAVAANVCSR